ncbi:hypothetical protein HanRHA438_Chr01g0032131 [Helianthus annuus]|uniref:Uncharacterized protein n=1 Tax=Helianthus annuus TaxID=4232 RepID=A0A251VNW1_HELAN|nr:hypothetical protein HanHA300_Chr01g0025631 [Helianthus annuus]KAJ0627609.1 hypothetical protein HanHA89_Chr01g0027721 [Helianthus annuus]KAJ0783909.1 hypothetical protein HanLR1_Chr01g0026311 [Helianthus annuus]KAJ0948835.1 hypothetical protein HanRHA438_Chr01g0032131 [Helianthus annuus]
MEIGAPPVAMAANKDGIMTEVDADVHDVMAMDVEEIEKPSESSPMTTDTWRCIMIMAHGLSSDTIRLDYAIKMSYHCSYLSSWCATGTWFSRTIKKRRVVLSSLYQQVYNMGNVWLYLRPQLQYKMGLSLSCQVRSLTAIDIGSTVIIGDMLMLVKVCICNVVFKWGS